MLLMSTHNMFFVFLGVFLEENVVGSHELIRSATVLNTHNMFLWRKKEKYLLFFFFEEKYTPYLYTTMIITALQ